MLAGETSKLIGILLGMGYWCVAPHNKFIKDSIAEYINGVSPAETLTTTDSTGWHGKTFVLTGGEVIGDGSNPCDPVCPCCCHCEIASDVSHGVFIELTHPEGDDVGYERATCARQYRPPLNPCLVADSFSQHGRRDGSSSDLRGLSKYGSVL
jgi:hypothetical protein